MTSRMTPFVDPIRRWSGAVWVTVNLRRLHVLSAESIQLQKALLHHARTGIRTFSGIAALDVLHASGLENPLFLGRKGCAERCPVR